MGLLSDQKGVAGLRGLLKGGAGRILGKDTARREHFRLAGFDYGVLAELVDNSQDAILITGEAGEVCYANVGYYQQFDIDQSVVPPPALSTILGRQDNCSDRLFRLQKAIAARQPAKEVMSFVQADKLHRVAVSVAPVSSTSPLCVWRIQRYYRTENSASPELQKFKQILEVIDTAPLGIGIVSETGVVEFANAIFADWVGLSPEEILSGKVTSTDIFEDSSAFWSSSEEERDLTYTGIERTIIVSVNGERIPISALYRIREDTDRGIRTLQLVMRDLRVQLSADLTQLREVEARFLRLFDIAPVGIVIVDQHGSVVESNSAFFKNFGMLFSSGDDFLSIVDETYVAEVRQRIADAARQQLTGQHVDIELHNRGEARSAQLYISPLRESGDASVVLYLIDTTEQRNLELQFSQSQKMQAVGQLAGGIAHDFNNLLTAIIGYSDLLLSRHDAGDPSFSDIHQIKQNANRAANLVRQLLAFSRQQTLQPAVISITDMLAELHNLLRRLLGQHIELTMTHGRNLGQVKADQGQLENVIINLAVNARDALAGNKGRLSIRTANISAEQAQSLDHSWMPSGDCVMIEVADDGPGIPKAVIGKIFEPFFTTKEVGKGTGLGLSTAYGIIKQQGGNIHVQSEVGEGATFRIYLPVYAEEEVQAENGEVQLEAGADLTGNGVILLVEDEDPVRAFASRALSGKGYTVLEADGPDQALEIVETRADEIDLVISDVVMPGMDGARLMKIIQQKSPGIRAIFISGYAENAFRDSDEPVEDYLFLPKPFTLKQLAARVKEAFADR